MWTSHPVRCVIVLSVILASVTSTVSGQGRGQRMRMETLRTEATIRGVSPRLLQVVTADNAPWLISVPNRPDRIVFRGTADPAWLQPGMWVRFAATLTPDKRRKEFSSQQPVGELTVITLRPGVEPGVVPDHGNLQRDALFNNEEDDERKEGKKESRENERERERGRERENEREREGKDDTSRLDRGRAVGQEVPCLVVGRLLELKDNKMRVAAGRVPVIAELSATAEVSLEMNDLTFARPGDKVEVNARFLPAQPGRAEGQELTITAAKPLTAEDWPAKGKRRSGRGRKSDDADAAKQPPTQGKRDGNGNGAR